ncbi:MAG: DNA alkylation repair protein [Micrococcaceae bacterium]
MCGKTIIEQLTAKKHGFKHVQAVGDAILAKGNSQALSVAEELSENEIYQARMCATHIYGKLSIESKVAYSRLLEKIVCDENWRVQEMLAKAFDQYCADIGSRDSLSTIYVWLTAKNPNQRRAASEGLRIWTSRPYFKDYPEVAIELLANFKADESKYVRTSVGNALRDISKKYPKLIAVETSSWEIANRDVQQTYNLATKFIK